MTTPNHSANRSSFILFDQCSQLSESNRDKALNILYRGELKMASAIGEHEWQGDLESGYRANIQFSPTEPPQLSFACTCPSTQAPCKHAAALLLHIALTSTHYPPFLTHSWVGQWVFAFTQYQLERLRAKGRDSQTHQEQHLLTWGWQTVQHAEFALNNSGPDFAGQWTLGFLGVLLTQWNPLLAQKEGEDLLSQLTTILKVIAAYPSAKTTGVSAICQQMKSQLSSEIEKYPALDARITTLIRE